MAVSIDTIQIDILTSLRHFSDQPAQLWEIDPSLLPVHICETIYHFISVTLNYHLFEFRRLLKTHLFG